MEFNASDFDGKKWMNFRSPDPKLSNGINNRASLVTKKGVRLDFNFQQAYEDEFHLKMRNLLISYHLADKISFLALIQYIGISDSYERIQEFKKELEARRQAQI